MKIDCESQRVINMHLIFLTFETVVLSKNYRAEIYP